MIIDSDDDETSQPRAHEQPDKTAFEDTVLEGDHLFPDIVQTLDLPLGSAARHIAVLPMPPSTAEAAASGGATILKERMVFAVSCTTDELYLVTIPLTPPSHQAKTSQDLRKGLLADAAGKGTWGETMTPLVGQTRYSDGLAIALVATHHISAKERSRSRDPPSARGTSSTRVVVASHTREASGTLRLWDVTLASKPGNVARVEPFQTEYLPAPLTSICFNPSQSTQLLSVTSQCAVRIYDYSVPSLPEDVSDGPFPTQGSWLLSLYPPFSRGSALSISRKPIIAAEWISQGRAVLALLADGQWGIWDIDGADPSTATMGSAPGLFSKHSRTLRGAALTTFSVTGYLEGTSPLRNPVSQKSPSLPGSGGEFVPMTPHTRRDALAASMAIGVEKLAVAKGGIEVLRAQPLRAAATPAGTDESAVLWIGSTDPIIVAIPAVSRFWDAQLRRGSGGGINLFSGAPPTRMIRVTEISAGLLGERCTGVGLIMRDSKHRHTSDTSLGGSTPAAEGLPVDVVVQGESRLVVVRESEDNKLIANRFLGLHKKKTTDNRSASAIIAYPRPEKPSSVAFNLSVSRVGNLGRSSRHRPSVKGIFASQAVILPSTERADVTGPAGPALLYPSNGRTAGLAFAQSLNVAADASDNDGEAEDRNVEEEVLDIMEIDRELEEMENERGSGRKNVFFEEV